MMDFVAHVRQQATVIDRMCGEVRSWRWITNYVADEDEIEVRTDLLRAIEAEQKRRLPLPMPTWCEASHPPGPEEDDESEPTHDIGDPVGAKS
jgi:hypothetical protein